jgi:hypothetical protein
VPFEGKVACNGNIAGYILRRISFDKANCNISFVYTSIAYGEAKVYYRVKALVAKPGTPCARSFGHVVVIAE